MNWLPINYESPPRGTVLFVMRRSDGIQFHCFGQWNGSEWVDYVTSDGDGFMVWPAESVTHWMPLPPLPTAGVTP